MREIKFRGKCTETNEWVYGQLVYLNGSPFIVGNLVEANEEYAALEWWNPVHKESVGQSTGVVDSVGDEIYEGDILSVTTPEVHTPNYDCAGGIIDYNTEESSEQLGVVEYDTDSFEYTETKVLKGKSEGFYHISLSLLNNTKVVGNVYDDNNLLKEGLE